MNDSSKFTPQNAAQFVEIVRRGNFRENACAQIGITPQTMRSWLRAASTGYLERRQLEQAERDIYIAWVRELDCAEAEAEDLMVTALRTAGIKDWRAAAWYLERRGPKRWGFKAQVEVSLQEELQRVLDVVEREVGGEVAARIFSALTDGDAGPGAPPGDGAPPGGSAPASGSPIH